MEDLHPAPSCMAGKKAEELIPLYEGYYFLVSRNQEKSLLSRRSSLNLSASQSSPAAEPFTRCLPTAAPSCLLSPTSPDP